MGLVCLSRGHKSVVRHMCLLFLCSTVIDEVVQAALTHICGDIIGSTR